MQYLRPVLFAPLSLLYHPPDHLGVGILDPGTVGAFSRWLARQGARWVLTGSEPVEAVRRKCRRAQMPDADFLLMGTIAAAPLSGHGNASPPAERGARIRRWLAHDPRPRLWAAVTLEPNGGPPDNLQGLPPDRMVTVPQDTRWNPTIAEAVEHALQLPASR